MNDHEPTQKLQRRGRLDGDQRRNLASLLDYMYTPAELAQTLGITRRQIYRVYRHVGMPCEVDDTGHVWINGVAFRDWYRQTYPKIELGESQAFCLTCRQAVEIVSPQTIERGGMSFLQSTCPHCGRVITRFTANHWKRSK